MKKIYLYLLLVHIAGCASVGGYRESALREQYIPIDVKNRTNTEFGNVIYLDKCPTDNSVIYIGIIPTYWEHSIADGVNFARAAGSLYGAEGVCMFHNVLDNAVDPEEIRYSKDSWRRPINTLKAFVYKNNIIK
jgi:hypothetical protein